MSDNRVLLITGASSGIGAASARAAAAAGFRVALAARSKDALEKLVGEIGEDRAVGLPCDVTDYESQQQMVARTLDRFGAIDAVFANAGLVENPGGSPRRRSSPGNGSLRSTSLALPIRCEPASKRSSVREAMC